MFAKHNDTITLVILDLVMPRKNGKEVGREIRSLRPDVKILFTSGYTADILEQKDILEENVDFISKPVLPHQLLVKIREMLDEKRSA